MNPGWMICESVNSQTNIHICRYINVPRKPGVPLLARRAADCGLATLET